MRTFWNVANMTTWYEKDEFLTRGMLIVDCWARGLRFQSWVSLSYLENVKCGTAMMLVTSTIVNKSIWPLDMRVMRSWPGVCWINIVDCWARGLSYKAESSGREEDNASHHDLHEGQIFTCMQQRCLMRFGMTWLLHQTDVEQGV